MDKWRTKGIILALLGIPLLLLSSFGTVSATLITGHDFENNYGTLYPPVSLDVVYDTETTILAFTWEGASWITTPFPTPFCPYASHWEVKDERGFSVDVDRMYSEGSEQFYYYNSAGTWLKVRVVWIYLGGLWAVIAECSVKLWISHTAALWDINEDGITDIVDIVLVQLAFGSHEGSPNWNPDCDVTLDGMVDIDDFVEVILHFGESY